MKTKYTIYMLTLLFSISCTAEERCKYKKDFVSKQTPISKDVVSSYWKNARDKRSDEYISILYLIYGNGDVAILEHKYCSMYNFEFSYIISDQEPYPTIERLVKIVSEHFKYAKIQPKFEIPLGGIISAELQNGNFAYNKALSRGLPDDKATYNNSAVEYSISYLPYEYSSSLLNSTLNFYLGIGGIP